MYLVHIHLWITHGDMGLYVAGLPKYFVHTIYAGLHRPGEITTCMYVRSLVTCEIESDNLIEPLVYLNVP